MWLGVLRYGALTKPELNLSKWPVHIEGPRGELPAAERRSIQCEVCHLLS